jgi:glycosyltransferase involved in cell wall biosynthesis
MNIWLVTVGEPLPIDSGSQRLLRAGLLGELLAQNGHQVTWWTSSFDHVRKCHRVNDDQVVAIKNNYTIRLLHGRGYARNVSVARLIDHWQIAQKFRRLSHTLDRRPDVVLCSFPPVELSAEAVRFGAEFGVPVALDIRDLWPDIFLNLAPPPLRPLARAILWPYFRLAKYALRHADAVLAVNEPFVDWGINSGRRARSAFDHAFPMAYPSRDPASDEQKRAVEFWSRFGVSQADGSFKIIFAGTIGRQFELEPVIEAAKALAGSNFKFILCGTGDRFDHIRMLAHAVPNVIMPGWVGAAEIWALMRLAQVGLAPYHDEESFTHSLPNKSLEYLSAGLPVVSSLPGALARLLADNRCGITYANRDARELRAALEMLRNNPKLRAAMGQNAKLVFETDYRAENVYAKMIAHLEALAARKAAP